ncbi:MAG: hypothetical protein H5U36_03990 [Candidatus Caldatribacterium sp.]|nr:hypothetical protein [Candidatus Caldatribacterium sp.]
MLEWSDRFSIGIPEIDAQNQKFFRQVNRLLVEWLENHILKMDQEMGKFLKEAIR